MKKLLALALLAGMGTQAFAVFFDTEPNNNASQAQTVNRANGPWADIGVASLTSNDSDWFRVRFNAGENITVSTMGVGNGNEDGGPDTVIALISTDGNSVLISNDDSGNGLMSLYRFAIRNTGDYYVAVTGFTSGDQTRVSYYTGNGHSQSGDYAVTISVVPEPATMLALAGALGALAARRRRK